MGLTGGERAGMGQRRTCRDSCRDNSKLQQTTTNRDLLNFLENIEEMRLLACEVGGPV